MYDVHIWKYTYWKEIPKVESVSEGVFFLGNSPWPSSRFIEVDEIILNKICAICFFVGFFSINGLNEKIPSCKFASDVGVGFLRC